jgi:hypothetical protein
MVIVCMFMLYFKDRKISKQVMRGRKGEKHCRASWFIGI